MAYFFVGGDSLKISILPIPEFEPKITNEQEMKYAMVMKTKAGKTRNLMDV